MSKYKLIVVCLFILGVYAWYRTFWPGVLVGITVYQVSEMIEAGRKAKCDQKKIK